jgi:hypothetical protein
MGVSVIGTAIVCLIIGVYLYLKFMRSSKYIKHVVVQDPQAATLYKQSKEKPKKRLSLQERMELSWQFIYDITEIVLNKFSPQDREEVHTLGQNLVRSGMKYQHVVDLGIRQQIEVSHTAAVVIDKDKTHGQGR